MLSKNKILLAIRTNKFDFQTLALYSYYVSNGLDVVLCVDETSKKIDTGNIPKVSINDDFLKKLGLFLKIPGYLWLSGDLCLYTIYNEYPEYEGYWLVEDDALIKKQNLNKFLLEPYLEKSDFSAFCMRNALKSWPWYESIKKIIKTDEISACSFGIVYISNRLCENAFKKRQQLVSLYSSEIEEVKYPNDESFIMNFFDKKEYNYLPLDHIYNEILFKNYKFSSYGEVFYFNSTLSNKIDGFYHPIIINQNPSDQIIRECNIFNKQKKDKNIIFDKKINEVNSNIHLIEKKYFSIILFNCVEGFNYEKIFKNIQIFQISSDYSKNDFYEKISDVIENNDKFSSFWVINANLIFKNINYLNIFNNVIYKERKSMFYLNKDLTINYDFMYFTQSDKKILNQLKSKESINFDKLKFINYHFTFKDLFEI